MAFNASLRRTPRLLLRRPSEAQDTAAHFKVFSHPDVFRHRPDPTPENEAESLAHLRRDIGHWDRHGFGRWAALLNGEVIGFGGLSYVEGWGDALNLSYHLHPDHWGGGYATELALEAVRMAKEELATGRIIGRVRSWNTGSVRVLERVGLTLDGPIAYGGAPGLLYDLKW